MNSLPVNRTAMPDLITIRDGLVLRWLAVEDASRIAEIFQADPSIQSRVTWAHGLKGEASIGKAIREFQTSDSIRYAIELSGRLVGYAGMWQDNGYMEGVVTNGQYGFGYFLDPAARSQGIVTAATAGLMTAAEARFEIKVWAVFCEDDNLASQAVLGHLGFIRTDKTFEEPKMHAIERRWEKVMDASDA